jgi:hypothetical protein
MKALRLLWFDMPRWARGIFLANLGYIVLTVFAFLWFTSVPRHPSWFFVFFLPATYPIAGLSGSSRLLLYHLLWCVWGAVLVSWFGEKKGIMFLVGGHFALSMGISLYGMMRFTLTH